MTRTSLSDRNVVRSEMSNSKPNVWNELIEGFRDLAIDLQKSWDRLKLSQLSELINLNLSSSSTNNIFKEVYPRHLADDESFLRNNSNDQRYKDLQSSYELALQGEDLLHPRQMVLLSGLRGVVESFMIEGKKSMRADFSKALKEKISVLECPAVGDAARDSWLDAKLDEVYEVITSKEYDYSELASLNAIRSHSIKTYLDLGLMKQKNRVVELGVGEGELEVAIPEIQAPETLKQERSAEKEKSPIFEIPVRQGLLRNRYVPIKSNGVLHLDSIWNTFSKLLESGRLAFADDRHFRLEREEKAALNKLIDAIIDHDTKNSNTLNITKDESNPVATFAQIYRTLGRDDRDIEAENTIKEIYEDLKGKLESLSRTSLKLRQGGRAGTLTAAAVEEKHELSSITPQITDNSETTRESIGQKISILRGGAIPLDLIISGRTLSELQEEYDTVFKLRLSLLADILTECDSNGLLIPSVLQDIGLSKNEEDQTYSYRSSNDRNVSFRIIDDKIETTSETKFDAESLTEILKASIKHLNRILSKIQFGAENDEFIISRESELLSKESILDARKELKTDKIKELADKKSALQDVLEASLGSNLFTKVSTDTDTPGQTSETYKYTTPLNKSITITFTYNSDSTLLPLPKLSISDEVNQTDSSKALGETKFCLGNADELTQKVGDAIQSARAFTESVAAVKLNPREGLYRNRLVTISNNGNNPTAKDYKTMWQKLSRSNTRWSFQQDDDISLETREEKALIEFTKEIAHKFGIDINDQPSYNDPSQAVSNFAQVCRTSFYKENRTVPEISDIYEELVRQKFPSKIPTSTLATRAVSEYDTVFKLRLSLLADILTECDSNGLLIPSVLQDIGLSKNEEDQTYSYRSSNDRNVSFRIIDDKIETTSETKFDAESLTEILKASIKHLNRILSKIQFGEENDEFIISRESELLSKESILDARKELKTDKIKELADKKSALQDVLTDSSESNLFTKVSTDTDTPGQTSETYKYTTPLNKSITITFTYNSDSTLLPLPTLSISDEVNQTDSSKALEETKFCLGNADELTQQVRDAIQSARAFTESVAAVKLNPRQGLYSNRLATISNNGNNPTARDYKTMWQKLSISKTRWPVQKDTDISLTSREQKALIEFTKKIAEESSIDISMDPSIYNDPSKAVSNFAQVWRTALCYKGKKISDVPGIYEELVRQKFPSKIPNPSTNPIGATRAVTENEETKTIG